MPAVAIALMGIGVAGFMIALLSADQDRPVPVHEPEETPTPGKTGYRRVDEILPYLRAAASQSKTPLGLSIGWIARESGGKLAEHPQPGPGDTKYDERGYYQLMPDESRKLGLDHKRLSADRDYSINGGLAALGYYSGKVDQLGVAPKGSAYYWRLVKLVHSMGEGAVKKLITAAEAAGATHSWTDLRAFVLAHEHELFKTIKHSPTKWVTFVDKVYAVGQPFGFGSTAGEAVAGFVGPIPGGKIFADIPDPLDELV